MTGEGADRPQPSGGGGRRQGRWTDLPATPVDLPLHQEAYRSALAATARVIQASLADFLR